MYRLNIYGQGAAFERCFRKLDTLQKYLARPKLEAELEVQAREYRESTLGKLYGSCSPPCDPYGWPKDGIIGENFEYWIE